MDSIDQRTPNWLDWRKGGIGSSDAPVIMELSPWKTRYELWIEKTGLEEKKQETNWAMQRGINFEPAGRACYEIMTGLDMPAALVEHAELPFLRASLDGRNAALKRCLEIKFPGRDDHELARSGTVPEKYWPQVQHILMVTGDDRLDYFSYHVAKGQTPAQGEGILVPVLPDREYISKLATEEIKFWELVKTATPPELSDRDVKQVKGLENLMANWLTAKSEYDIAKDKLEEIRKMIIQAAPHPRFQCAGVQAMKIIRRGAIDYESVPELKGVDLERYRRKSIESWNIVQLKKSDEKL